MVVPIYLSALILILQCHAACGEIFSSLADMEGLVSTEFELMKQLDNYIQEEEIRLKRLRGYNTLSCITERICLIPYFSLARFLEEYENNHHEASEDVSKYLANPLNAYLLVKRLTSDWKKVEGVMTQNAGTGMLLDNIIYNF
jgi:prolyl 4-hydroxylase